MHRPIPDLRGLKAVFFDAGFTLMEPTLPMTDIYIGAAEKLGAEVDHEVFKKHMGECWGSHARERGRSADLTTSDADERRGWHAFTGAVAAPFPALVERHEEWLTALISHFDDPASWMPYPGVNALLRTLRERGLTLGVISNWHTALNAILAAHGLTEQFDFVLISAEHGWRKPHPSIFAEALDRAKATAGEALHVGDSMTDDVHGATAVGIHPVLVSASPPAGDLPHTVPHIRETARLLDAIPKTPDIHSRNS